MKIGCSRTKNTLRATKNTSPKPKPESHLTTKFFVGLTKFFAGTKKVFAGTIPSSTGMKKHLTGMIPANNFIVPTHPGMNTGDSGLLKFSPLTVKTSPSTGSG